MSVGVAFQSTDNLTRVAANFCAAHGIDSSATRKAISNVLRQYRLENSSPQEQQEDEEPAQVNVYYRLSDQAIPENADNVKLRPAYVTDKRCLLNALRAFSGTGIHHETESIPLSWWAENFHIIADKVSDSTWQWLKTTVNRARQALAIVEAGQHRTDISGSGVSEPQLPVTLTLTRTDYGHGAGSFNHAMRLALRLQNPRAIAYFLEDDYIHLPTALTVLREGRLTTLVLRTASPRF